VFMSSTTTVVAVVKGTAGYMDPDLLKQMQMKGQATVTPAVDLFALGVMICEVLTGVRPASPDEVTQTMAPIPLKDLFPTLQELVRSCVAPAAAQRPASVQVLLDHPFFQLAPPESECCICYGTVPLHQGIFCHAAAAPHFCCDMCFDMHVKNKSEESVGKLQKRKGRVPCFGDATCSSRLFDDSEAALHVTPGAFKQHIAARARVVEATVSSKLERENEERLSRELERWQKLSEEERKTYAGRLHIVENILTLKCPRCRKAFLDFNGCFALKCEDDDSAIRGAVAGGAGGCGCGFCAWCLWDCGADAHRHVANCV
jgi:hypothetical protein